MVAVRRLFGWLAGLAGIAALARLLSRRAPTEPASAPQEPDPAQALREKLSEARAEPEPPLQHEPPEQPVADAPAAAPESLDERRARVHAKAQEAIDAMQEPEQPA